MNVLLIGANGQLGSDLVQALSQHELLLAVQPGSTRCDRPGSRVIELDVSEPEQVRAVVDEFRPALIVNTAAFHRVDDIERDAWSALQVNAWAAQQMALICREADIAMLYVSTDYVFDGSKRAPYIESDLPNPLSAYGASKLAGELLIRAAWHKHYIIRTCGLYGLAGSMGKGGNFVNTMLRLGRESEQTGKPVRVVYDQICTPTFTQDLAAQIAVLIETGRYGIYHATSDGQCSWYEFTREIFQLAGVCAEPIPITSAELNLPARRPPYSVLRNQALQELGIDHMRDWHEALADYLRQAGALRV
ncbi:MAG: dTDP-4-dehydrorhamnose reductase [Anaerolineae bacterium]|nr:dTDP-4-dehydrorhamnose reductase [Thermoflexales bacterium]MDW8406846.1 dTDP-4-dehydrorhamnose reductase [Anaerolineae bacterium]